MQTNYLLLRDYFASQHKFTTFKFFLLTFKKIVFTPQNYTEVNLLAIKSTFSFRGVILVSADVGVLIHHVKPSTRGGV